MGGISRLIVVLGSLMGLLFMLNLWCCFQACGRLRGSGAFVVASGPSLTEMITSCAKGNPPPNTLACVSGGTASTGSRRTSSGRLWAEQRSLLLWQQCLPPTVGESINRGSESECAQCQGPCDRKGKYFIGGVLWVTLETA